ncbi:DUF6777 domain-containing protein [Saccharopolyspora spinosporotrichia]
MNGRGHNPHPEETHENVSAVYRSGRSRLRLAVAATVAVGLAGTTAWALLPGGTATKEVRLEPTSAEDRGTATGEPDCDANRLVADLQADPDKSNAWAGVFGMAPEEIPAFVGGLTPALLPSDTAVTSHDYESGTYVAHPAVLQAGTSVFVGGTGEPAVKCVTGDPLTRGEIDAGANFTGQGWYSFQPGSVTGSTSGTGSTGGTGGTGGSGGTGGGGPVNPGPSKEEIEKLRKKAQDAHDKAVEARKIAEDARFRANDKRAEANIFTARVNELIARGAPQAEIDAAREEAASKDRQAKQAEQAAKDAEAVQKIAEGVADKAAKEFQKTTGKPFQPRKITDKGTPEKKAPSSPSRTTTRTSSSRSPPRRSPRPRSRPSRTRRSGRSRRPGTAPVASRRARPRRAAAPAPRRPRAARNSGQWTVGRYRRATGDTAQRCPARGRSRCG